MVDIFMDIAFKCKKAARRLNSDCSCMGCTHWYITDKKDEDGMPNDWKHLLRNIKVRY